MSTKAPHGDRSRHYTQRRSPPEQPQPLPSSCCSSDNYDARGDVPVPFAIGVYVVVVAKRPAATDEERLEVCRIALAAVASGALDDFTSTPGMLDDKWFPFPADVFTGLGADALSLAGVTRSEPVSLDDFAERYLPEYQIRGNTSHQKMRAAINLTVGEHAGIAPDYSGVAGWWQQQDLSWFAFLTLVLMVRIAAERTSRPVADVCSDLAAARGIVL